MRSSCPGRKRSRCEERMALCRAKETPPCKPGRCRSMNSRSPAAPETTFGSLHYRTWQSHSDSSGRARCLSNSSSAWWSSIRASIVSLIWNEHLKKQKQPKHCSQGFPEKSENALRYRGFKRDREVRMHVLFHGEEHGVGLFNESLHSVGEAGHCGSVYDSVIRAPA